MALGLKELDSIRRKILSLSFSPPSPSSLSYSPPSCREGKILPLPFKIFQLDEELHFHKFTGEKTRSFIMCPQGPIMRLRPKEVAKADSFYTFYTKR